MTLLGFSMGTTSTAPSAAAAPSTMNMSLDELIKSRREGDGGRRKGRQNTGGDKTPSGIQGVADKVRGAQNARRKAKLDHKRGIRTDDKPSDMEVRKEVAKLAAETANKKLKEAEKAKKRAGAKGGAERAAERKEFRETKKKAKAADSRVSTGVLGRPPSKKAVKAAVAAMEEKGFQIPEGMQMVISFAPAPPGGVKAIASHSASAVGNAPKSGENDQQPSGEKKPSGRRRNGGNKKSNNTTMKE